jgi:Fur family transcriptional regulator, iron response regulator
MKAGALENSNRNDRGSRFNCATPDTVKGWRPDPSAQDIGSTLRRVGLRPTQQRMSLAKLLFAQGHRHVSAEMLHAEAVRSHVPVSLATVYNTLHQFTEAGLLRELAVDGTRTYFDTDMGAHHHFFIEGDEVVMDVPPEALTLGRVPEAPEGMEIVRVDVVVRVRRKRR